MAILMVEHLRILIWMIVKPPVCKYPPVGQSTIIHQDENVSYIRVIPLKLNHPMSSTGTYTTLNVNKVTILHIFKFQCNFSCCDMQCRVPVFVTVCESLSKAVRIAVNQLYMPSWHPIFWQAPCVNDYCCQMSGVSLRNAYTRPMRFYNPFDLLQCLRNLFIKI